MRKATDERESWIMTQRIKLDDDAIQAALTQIAEAKADEFAVVELGKIALADAVLAAIRSDQDATEKRFEEEIETLADAPWLVLDPDDFTAISDPASSTAEQRFDGYDAAVALIRRDGADRTNDPEDPDEPLMYLLVRVMGVALYGNGNITYRAVP